MEQEVQKKEVILNNESYKERFQFILSLGENIICQRYFRINGFTQDAIESVELKETLDDIVYMIQKDLESKSRVYQFYTRNEPVKLTGFYDTYAEVMANRDSATYFTYPDDIPNTYEDTEKPEPYEFMFKFSFLMDGNVVYERIWDGGDYPRYVRNSVDLTNSDHLYKDKNPLSLSFNVAVVRGMTIDKTDLIYTIIKSICDVASLSYTEKYGEYTKKDKYGKKQYRYSLYNEDFIIGWKDAVTNKTREYFSGLYPSKRYIEKIDNYM